MMQPAVLLLSSSVAFESSSGRFAPFRVLSAIKQWRRSLPRHLACRSGRVALFTVLFFIQQLRRRLSKAKSIIPVTIGSTKHIQNFHTAMQSVNSSSMNVKLTLPA
jgi:hypothetical protein